MNKILQFSGKPANTAKAHAVSMTPTEPATQVHQLLELPQAHIYADRFKWDPHIEFFFKRLTELGEVTIVHDGTISRDSILKVGIGTLAIYDLGVDEFVDFVSVYQDGVFLEDTEGYLMSALEWIGIHRNIVQAWEETRKSFHIHDKNSNLFDIRFIHLARWTPEYIEGYCNAGIYLDSDEDFQFVATADEFKNPIGMPLAYILSHLRQEYVTNWYSLDSTDSNVVIDSFEWINVYNYTISTDILDAMLIEAIKRLTPQFASFSDAKCLNEFYERIVAPRLRDQEESKKEV